MQLELRKATSIRRSKDGAPFSWTLGGVIASFSRPQDFKQHVQQNIESLRDAVAFTGNAQLLSDANNFLAGELKRVGAL